MTESPDLIVPTMTKAKLFYDQPAVLQLDFSETIDVDPTLLIDKTKIKIVDYQGQTTGASTSLCLSLRWVFGKYWKWWWKWPIAIS